ncbi:MAG: AmmeMemoRadiSam system protein B [Candidatus Marinimicrobia bacterium]|nr:AmmeMemoRadiSam system protein B [Candidatus Neomarinimicrobiota bacterium]MBL7047195.1 AmmeMemoRadiSam system protein B [Candidatus Neomarinimicrobiota bacterium]
MIREPAVAGTFYPAHSATLSENIQSYLMGADIDQEFEPLGFIVPHAGYIYSGPVAAYAFKHLIGKTVRRVIILAPSHFDSFNGISIYPGEGLKTPLGVVNVDKDARKSLVDEGLVTISQDGFRQEHSLEVQLPFLQSVLESDWEVVPLVMGFQNQETIEQGTRVLSKYIDQQSVIVISSDLSHFYPYKMANDIDSRFCGYFETGDYEGLWEAYMDKRVEACGFGPIYAFLSVIKDREDISCNILDFRNSGDTAGDKSQVVGYASIGFFWTNQS